MAGPSPVRASRPQDGVLLLTLSRPRARNSVNAAMITGIVDALDAASRDAGVRAVVITGDPAGNAFCAGADVSAAPAPKKAGGKKREEGAATRPRRPTAAEHRDGGGWTSLAAMRCTKPIICAINGAAVGMGLAFPVACDIRIAAADAKVGFPMAARGLVNESISSWLLPRLIGAGHAKELVFTGRVFPASDAPQYAPGLFNYILPKEQVLPKALALASEIAATTSGMSVAMCKRLMDDAWEYTPEDAMLAESRCLHHVSYVRNKDMKEGFASFQQKRPPKWVHDAWDDLPEFMHLRRRVSLEPRGRGGGLHADVGGGTARL